MKIKKLWAVSLNLFCILLIPNYTEASEDRVIDHTHLFNEVEYQKISNRVNMLRQETNMDVVILTTLSTEGKNPITYANDFYDANHFGVGKNMNVFLLV